MTTFPASVALDNVLPQAMAIVNDIAKAMTVAMAIDNDLAYATALLAMAMAKAS